MLAEVLMLNSVGTLGRVSSPKRIFLPESTQSGPVNPNCTSTWMPDLCKQIAAADATSDRAYEYRLLRHQVDPLVLLGRIRVAVDDIQDRWRQLRRSMRAREVIGA